MNSADRTVFSAAMHDVASVAPPQRGVLGDVGLGRHES